MPNVVFCAMLPGIPADAIKRGATASTDQGGGKNGATKKDRKRAPRPPPGISGTVATLVISPDWFASKDANQRDNFWWSPGRLKIF